MGGRKRVATQYCFLRYYEPIREAIKLKMGQRKLTYVMLSKALKKDRSMITRYISGEKPKALTQLDVLNLCYILGIEVDINLKINEEDFTVSPEMLGGQE